MNRCPPCAPATSSPNLHSTSLIPVPATHPGLIRSSIHHPLQTGCGPVLPALPGFNPHIHCPAPTLHSLPLPTVALNLSGASALSLYLDHQPSIFSLTHTCPRPRELGLMPTASPSQPSPVGVISFPCPSTSLLCPVSLGPSASSQDPLPAESPPSHPCFCLGPHPHSTQNWNARPSSVLGALLPQC